MNVLVVTSSYPSASDPIAGRFVADMVAALPTEHSVQVLTSARGNIERQPTVTHLGLPMRGAIPESFREHPIRTALAAASWAAGLYHAAKSIVADIALVHWAFPHALLLTRARPSLPQIAFMHGSDARLLAALGASTRQRCADALLRSTKRLVFSHSKLRDDFLASVKPWKRDIVAETVVESMGYSDALLEVSTTSDCMRVLFLSRLEPQKDPMLYLRCASSMKNGARRFSIAGSGSLQASVVVAAHAAGVDWLGVASPACKHELFRTHNVFVFCGGAVAQEGLPVVLLEAMAAGHAVVARNTGGVGEVVRHNENGLLFRSERELYECLRRLDDPGFRLELGARARESVRARAWSKVLPRMLPELF